MLQDEFGPVHLLLKVHEGLRLTLGKQGRGARLDDGLVVNGLCFGDDHLPVLVLIEMGLIVEPGHDAEVCIVGAGVFTVPYEGVAPTILDDGLGAFLGAPGMS